MSEISDAIKILNSFQLTNEDFEGLAHSDIATQKGWAELWGQQQAFLKGKFDATSSAVQALSLFSDPANVARALEIQKRYLNDPDHPEHRTQPLPPSIQVPTGLRDAYWKYRGQVAQTQKQEVEAEALSQQVFRKAKDHGLGSAADVDKALKDGTLNQKLLETFQGSSLGETEKAVELFKNWGVLPATIAQAKAQSEKLQIETKAIVQKVGQLIQQTYPDIDIDNNPDELEKLADSGMLYQILSASKNLSAEEITKFGQAVQATAGTKKSIQDAIAAAAQAKKAGAEADAIARKFAPSLAKVGIGDAPGLLSFSAAIDDGSLMTRIEKLTTMVGKDGLTVADLQQITQTAKGLLDAHLAEATMDASIREKNAQADISVWARNLLYGGGLQTGSLYGPGKRTDHFLKTVMSDLPDAKGGDTHPPRNRGDAPNPVLGS